MIERRAGLNFRVQGRTVSGTALRYGDTADMGRFREMFVSGAFDPIGSVALNLQHDESRVLAKTGNGLVLADGPRSLEVRAALTGKAEHELVRRGVLRGFSVEFRAQEQRYEGSTRIIEKAELTGLALCDAGAYPQSNNVEARARSGRTLRSTIPYDSSLACECIARAGQGSGGSCIPLARFSKLSGDLMAETIADALGELDQILNGRDVLAIGGDYKRALGSASRGTLRAKSTDTGLDLEIDIPAGTVGDEIVAVHEGAGVVVRPVVDMERSEFVDTDRGREYSKPFLKAILVGATDSKEGWPVPRIEYDGDRSAPAPRTRSWLWL